MPRKSHPRAAATGPKRDVRGRGEGPASQAQRLQARRRQWLMASRCPGSGERVRPAPPFLHSGCNRHLYGSVRRERARRVVSIERDHLTMLRQMKGKMMMRRRRIVANTCYMRQRRDSAPLWARISFSLPTGSLSSPSSSVRCICEVQARVQAPGGGVVVSLLRQTRRRGAVGRRERHERLHTTTLKATWYAEMNSTPFYTTLHNPQPNRSTPHSKFFTTAEAPRRLPRRMTYWDPRVTNRAPLASRSRPDVASRECAS